jgi:peptide/nickel transport system substrate-binding protein
MAQIAITYVDDITATGGDSFVMTMKSPSTLIIDAMAKPSGNVLFIMPERFAQLPNTEQVLESIGSGPFTFDRAEWVPGQTRIYRRNESYVPREDPQDNLAGAKVPGVDVIEYTIMPDDATRQAALLNDEVDYLGNMAHDLVDELRADPDLVVETRDIRGEQLWLRFNHLVPPFDDQKLRQAIYWAVTQDEYMGSLIPDPELWKTCYSMYGCGTEYSTEVGSEPLQAQDLEKAKALVAESSYAGQPIVFLDTTNHPLLHGANIRTAETFRQIGLEVELQGIAVATLHQRRAIKTPVDEGGWNLFHTTFATIDVFNPLVNPAINASCAQDNWPGWPCSEEIQQLRQDFAAAKDADEKQRIATEVQRLAFELGTHVPLGVFYKVDAWNNRLKGVGEASVAHLWGISIEE